MMRSGTTVLRLILGKVFNDQKCFDNYKYRWEVNNTHGYENIVNDNNLLITTWRDPRDVVASIIRVRNIDPSDTDAIIKQCKRILTTFHSIRQAENENPTLVLKYENWHEDFDYLFNALERTYNGKITEKVRNLVKEEYSKKSVIKKQESFSGFNQWDKETHIHGNHIHSGFKQWDTVFTKEQIEIINNELAPMIKYWEELK